MSIIHTAVHGFAKLEYDVLENERLETQLELNVKGIFTQFPSDYNFSGTIESEAITASRT